MKKYILAIAIVSATVFTGCIKETVPQGDLVTSEQVAKSTSALKALVNAIPVSMMKANNQGYLDSYNFHGDFGLPAIHMMTDFMCGDVATLGANPYYNRFYFYCMNNASGNTTWPTAYFWDAYYSYIKTCNDIIRTVDYEQATGDALTAVGQAYAYRALCYLDLARLYEPKPNKYTDVSKVLGLTVPVITENTTEDEAGNNPRLPKEEMYAFILEDLAKAETALKDADKSAYTTPTIGAVYALEARAYLEMGYWDDPKAQEYLAKADEYAKKCIDESGRVILTQDEWEDPTNGFNNGAANKSWILGATLSSENQENIITFTAHISSEAVYGYAPLSQLGADKAFYEKISYADFRKHSWLDPQFIADPSANQPYAYKFAGSAQNKKDFIEGSEELQIGPAVAYENIKFRPAKGEVSDYAVGNTADHPFIRIEEMYFIRMEALARQNKLGEAKSVLEDFMSHRYVGEKYTCPASDLEGMIDEILFQKRVEFWGEGIIMFDLKRNDRGFVRGYEGTNQASVYCLNCPDGRSPQWNLVITRAESQSNVAVTDATNNPDPTGLIPEWK